MFFLILHPGSARVSFLSIRISLSASDSLNESEYVRLPFRSFFVQSLLLFYIHLISVVLHSSPNVVVFVLDLAPTTRKQRCIEFKQTRLNLIFRHLQWENSSASTARKGLEIATVTLTLDLTHDLPVL